MLALLFAMHCGTTHAVALDLQQFASGAFHRCALTTGGAVQCLGESNDFGQIGNGRLSPDGSDRPVTIIASGATKLVAGNFFTCAIVGAALDCWGNIPVPGGQGKKPTQVIATGVTDVAAGEGHVCAIVRGAVQCWGANFTGQSGHGEYLTGQKTPWTVIESGASAIAAGGEQSCAIVDGALWCWGRTGLERNSMDVAFGGGRPPIRVFATGASGVAAGTSHTCAIVDGALWCWGDNSRGQVGVGVSVEHARRSANMPPANTAARFVDGEQHCFSSGTGEVKCGVDHPVQVIASGVTAVSARFNQTCAIAYGALQCWGANARGRLGIASADADVVKPTAIIAGGVSYVAVGNSICAVVDGALRCADNGAFNSTDSPFGLSDREARLGVWRGTIGDEMIMACLERASYESSYYYLRHKFGIALTDTNGHGEVWVEGDDDKPRASWKLQLPRGNRLDGEWSNAEGTRKLPIRLTLAARAGGNGQGCGLDGAPKVAFNAPRVAAQKLTVMASNNRYRVVSALDGRISMVMLKDTINGAAPFNMAMRNWFRDQVADYYWCAAQPRGGHFYKEREILFHSGSWLVVQESYEVYCGGAYPSGGIADFETWNLATGKRVAPWSWIRDSKGGYGGTAPDNLNALLLANATRNKEEDGCKDSVNSNNSYLLRPGERGLIFSTSFAHVIQACNEDIELPYSKLMPFLTREGKSAVDSLVKPPPPESRK